jgi:hypothetical protein
LNSIHGQHPKPEFRIIGISATFSLSYRACALSSSPRVFLAPCFALRPAPGNPLKGFDLTDTLIPRKEIKDGGPPKDGIPALTDPKFLKATAAEFPGDKDPVLGFSLGEEAKAYPVAILDRHEIVTDRVGGKWVAITDCPLCGSGVAFNAERNGKRMTFGVSGLLF